MLVWYPSSPHCHHLGPWNGEQESVGHRQAVHRCGLVLGVVPAGRIAVGRHLIAHALLIMTFGIRDQVGPGVATEPATMC